MQQDWKAEREKKIERIMRSLDDLGKGLYKAQVEVKVVPWKNTWETTSMMMERQEQIILLLEDIKVLLERMAPKGEAAPRGKASSAPSAKKAPAKGGKVRKADIEAADYNRLRKMCRDAGLAATGKKDVLKKELFKYYKYK